MSFAVIVEGLAALSTGPFTLVMAVADSELPVRALIPTPTMTTEATKETTTILM
jgi:hypothetical protein